MTVLWRGRNYADVPQKCKGRTIKRAELWYCLLQIVEAAIVFLG